MTFILSVMQVDATVARQNAQRRLTTVSHWLDASSTKGDTWD